MTSLVTAPQLVSIVDDDNAVREATSDASAEEFLLSGQLEDTVCLVTDLRMPGASGIELQQRLIDAGHHIPTIVVTAHPEEAMRSAAMEAGALALLAKPLSEQHLLAWLETAFVSSSARA
jgi:FixJ family two-component response regulator